MAEGLRGTPDQDVHRIGQVTLHVLGRDAKPLADRHIRPGWVRTIHSAQGATAERVIAHLEAFRANIVDAGAAYVAISRARSHAAIYTDSRASLTEALGLRGGAQIGAIDGQDAGIALS